MEMNEIREKLDELLKNYKLTEGEELLQGSLKNARESGRKDIEMGVANELTGFYRDCGRFEESLEYAELSEELLKDIDPSPRETAAALLNSANAARAAGLLHKAYKYYDRIEQIPETFSDNSLKASYYNNLALLHQEAGKWEQAAECLRSALEVAGEQGDEIRQAISRSNLAVCLVQLGKTSDAEKTLEPALKIFAGRSPSDFHYSAALAALGDIRLAEGDHKRAALAYEAALSEIELHMGRNNFYDIVAEKLNMVYEKTERPAKGIDISRCYYNAFGAPMIKRNFGDISDKIACGLAGEGSECLGYDDEVSRDHDFAPGFCIWVNDLDNDIPQSRLEDLRKAYFLLPGSYMGLTRNETERGRGRRGVILLSEFLEKFTGFGHIPREGSEWLRAKDEDLACAVNGQVFSDTSGFFVNVRRRLKSRPQAVTAAKLSEQLELMAKHGQYNYPRMKGRGDEPAAFFELSEFMQSAIRAAHLMEGKYAPYRKWLFVSGGQLKRLSVISEMVREISRGVRVTENIEKICTLTEEELIRQGYIPGKCGYLAEAARLVRESGYEMALADKIAELEWRAFDKVSNVGGRADCQDDPETFFIMRRSQYYCFPYELLSAIYSDFTAAVNSGRNPITEKYGYMMETSAPEEFAEIADKLPPVSGKKRALCNAIIPIQVGWMEDFASRYPGLGGRARVIHTSEDTLSGVSYETYLRGELYTYSDSTLELYGRFIVSVYSRGENLAENIMKREVGMYGYDSLDKAEKNVN